MPRIQIEEVLSFYTQFRRKPIGRWHLAGLPQHRPARCAAPSGSSSTSRRSSASRPGQTTADGRFTLSTVECLASCGTAPVVHGRRRPTTSSMTPEKIDALLEDCDERPEHGDTPKLLMTFPVTRDLAHARRLSRARRLRDAREGAAHDDSREEVERGGHRLRASRAAAARPFRWAAKWAVVQPSDGQPHYLCANADEGEPGTFKDRWILEHAPHLLLESMLIAAYALQVRHAFVYIRGEFDLPLPPPRRGAGGGLRRRATSASASSAPTSRATSSIYRGAGSYVCGEASASSPRSRASKGYPRNRPPRLTVRGPLSAADRRQQRRDAGQHRRDHRARRRGVHARSAPPRIPGTRLISISGHVKRPGRLRDRDRLPVAEVHLRGLRRHPRRHARSRPSSPAASRPRC